MDSVGQMRVENGDLFSSTECPTAATMGKVTEYSQSSTRWVHDFHAAFEKMITAKDNTSVCTAGLLYDVSA